MSRDVFKSVLFSSRFVSDFGAMDSGQETPPCRLQAATREDPFDVRIRVS